MTALCFTSCEEDLCEGVMCNNDGYCEEGDCICPVGFGGVDCSTPLTPTSITITRVDLLSFPEEPYNGGDGGQWDDDGTGPDIAFFIAACGEFPPISFSTDDFYPDAVNGQVYSFNFQAEIELGENIPFTSSEHPNNSALVCFGFQDLDLNEDGGVLVSHSMGGGYPTFLYWDNPEFWDGPVIWSGHFPEYITYQYDGGISPLLAYELGFQVEYTFD